ncbi:MAG: SLC13 family permease [bacterium]
MADQKIIITIIFILASALTIYLILRRPFLYIRLGMRHCKIGTYFLGALLGPILIIIFGILSYGQIIDGLNGRGGFNPFGILILFLSMVFMSIFLDITGFFEYCARVALKFSKADGTLLFFSLYAIVSLLTIVTSNDIIILTFTPFIYYFAKDAGINPKPYLIAEFFAANTWSMMLYIGNPTNILLAAAFGVHFDKYTKWMFFPTLAAGVVNIGMLYIIFNKDIKRPLVTADQKNPAEAVTDKPGALLGIFVLSACIVFLIIAPYFNIQMWIVSLGFALILLTMLIMRDSYASLLKKRINKKKNKFAVTTTFQRMPWTIVPFVLSLFITVEALRMYGISEHIGQLFMKICKDSTPAYIFVYGISSVLSANFLNNIPMTVAFVPIIQGLSGKNLSAALLATTIGSNLGANVTPVGALAGIMWMSILHGKEFTISFKEFIYYGLLVTPICLFVCLSILSLEFIFF